MCMHAQFFHFCRPVILSTCRPNTCNMVLYRVCILLRVSEGLASQAFRCESMPSPLNILPYDCPCFARMRISFTSVDLSTCRSVDLSTCQPVNLSTCQPVDLSHMEFAFCCGGLGAYFPGIPLRRNAYSIELNLNHSL